MREEPHLSNGECFQDHCYVHHVDEVADEDTFRVCFECNHVYATSKDVLREETRVRLAMNRTAMFEGVVSLILDVDQSFCCPLCVHDW